MTTPEKLRRRQRIELVVVLIVAIGSIIYGVFNEQRQEARDACIVGEFREARQVQNKRANLAEESSRIQLRADEIIIKVIEDIASAKDQDDVARAFVQFSRAEEKLTNRFKVILEKRERSSIPKFPDGRCE